jgi:hypothetical protein
MQVPHGCGEKKHQSRAWPRRERRHRDRLVEGYHDRNIQRHRLEMKQQYLTETIKERRQEISLQSFYRALTSEDKALLRQAKVTADPQPTLAERFREQSDKWHKETQHFSSPGQRTIHPSYLAIMGMGNENPQEVIKLMLRDMQQNRRPWFLALSYLAKDNPVKQSDAGKTDKMIKAWVNWGKAHRLI